MMAEEVEVREMRQLFEAGANVERYATIAICLERMDSGSLRFFPRQ
jgi:hypothetical protein